MLDEKMLRDMPAHTAFATGVATDDMAGINMSNSGIPLRWIAKRGGIHDWAIYCQDAEMSFDSILKHGDKIANLETVRRLVPCDDAALALYRR